MKSEKWKGLVSVELNDRASWYTLPFKSGSKIRLSCVSGKPTALLRVREPYLFCVIGIDGVAVA